MVESKELITDSEGTFDSYTLLNLNLNYSDYHFSVYAEFYPCNSEGLKPTFERASVKTIIMDTEDIKDIETQLENKGRELGFFK